DLARIMDRPVIRLAVAPRGLHAHLGRDVALGEAGLEDDAGRLVRAHGGAGEERHEAEGQCPGYISPPHGACSFVVRGAWCVGASREANPIGARPAELIRGAGPVWDAWWGGIGIICSHPAPRISRNRC